MTIDINTSSFRHIHHTDTATINRMYDEYSPVFTLSTGRSGTKFLSALLNISPDIQSYHEAFPGLQYFVNYAFQNQNRMDVLNKIIDTSRMELILDALIHNKVYAEANQCLTFFAYQLKDLFIASKFIHIVRHPGDFISSAVRKGWYKNDSLWEEGRIRIDSKQQWDRMGQIEKLAWLWRTTNHFAEGFKETIPADRVLIVRIEDLVEDITIVEKLFDFIGVNCIEKDAIVKLQNTKLNQLQINDYEPPNMFKRNDFPAYTSWPEEFVMKIRPYVAELCARYDYRL